MPTLSLTIHGAPIGKGRPRFVRATGHVRKDESTAEWEGRARGEVAAILPPSWTRLDEPVALYTDAIFERPANLTCNHKRPHAHPDDCSKGPQTKRIPYTRTPDWDNVAKITGDALKQAGLVKDDARVYLAGEREQYGLPGEAPHLIATIVWGADLARLPWPPDNPEPW